MVDLVGAVLLAQCVRLALAQPLLGGAEIRQQASQIAAGPVNQAEVQRVGEPIGTPTSRQRLEDDSTTEQVPATMRCQESAEIFTEAIHAVASAGPSIARARCDGNGEYLGSFLCVNPVPRRLSRPPRSLPHARAGKYVTCARARRGRLGETRGGEARVDAPPPPQPRASPTGAQGLPDSREQPSGSLVRPRSTAPLLPAPPRRPPRLRPPHRARRRRSSRRW